MNKNNLEIIYKDCLKSASVQSREEIKSDTPLRLSVAASLAFPDGSMTASGLRREGARGRQVIASGG